MNVLINAANLHVGGGVQVAASFLTELANLLKQGSYDGKIKFDILCSDTVKRNLSSNFDFGIFNCFSVCNVYGMKRLDKQTRNKFNGYDVCFTIFGPLYFKPKCGKHICGFAQSWIAYPNNLAFQQLSLINKFRNYLKFKLQWWFFKLADELVVEQNHVKTALIANRQYPEGRLTVVDNCISNVFSMDELDWGKIDYIKISDIIDLQYNLGFIGRGYSHKNLSILPEVSRVLIEKYGMQCNFVFTLTDDEMKNLGFDSLDNFFTVGPIEISKCPSFYQLIDGLIFPSLLECFSATPLEAMSMRVPVFASDLPFISDICKHNVFYFNPLDAYSIAESIYIGLSNVDLCKEKIERAKDMVVKMPNAMQRAIKYVNLITR